MLLILFQPQIGSMDNYTPIIMMISLLIACIFILKIGLAISKAQVRKSMKWTAISFGIQFGIIFFISSPMMLLGMFIWRGPPPLEVLIPTIVISVFVEINVVNLLHRIGIKKSIIIAIFLIVPITAALFAMGFVLGDLVYTY
ncbi:MAG: hypothetical protein ACFE85_02585 [Candidatus Hodarchaeota archaeon]